MQEREIEAAIEDYLTRSFLVEIGGELTRESDLFEAGVIDSYGFVELVGFLEQTWGVSFDDDDLASEAMASLAGIAGLVGRKRAAAAE